MTITESHLLARKAARIAFVVVCEAEGYRSAPILSLDAAVRRLEWIARADTCNHEHRVETITL